MVQEREQSNNNSNKIDQHEKWKNEMEVNVSKWCCAFNSNAIGRFVRDGLRRGRGKKECVRMSQDFCRCRHCEEYERYA